MHEEVTIQYKSRFFLLFLLDDGRIRIREVQKQTDPDPGGPKTDESGSITQNQTNGY
jgi:hypothetical protein